jgi:hypothetical protein
LADGAWREDGAAAIMDSYDEGNVLEKVVRSPSPLVKAILDADAARVAKGVSPVLQRVEVGRWRTWEWAALYCLSMQAANGRPEALTEIRSMLSDNRETPAIRETLRLLAGGEPLGKAGELLAFRSAFNNLKAAQSSGKETTTDAQLRSFATGSEYIDLVSNVLRFQAKEQDLARAEEMAVYLRLKEQSPGASSHDAATLTGELWKRGVLPRIKGKRLGA